MDRTPVVPVVDIADVERAVDPIARACSRTGFFAAVGHGLDVEIPSIFAAAHSFFGQSTPTKERSAMIANNGYAGLGSARAGGKEMFDVALAGYQRWPELTGFRGAVEQYQVAALAVAARVLRAIAIGLDVAAGFFADRMHHPQCFLRMLRYPARPTGAAPDVLTGQHTDYGAITLLATDGVAGLEVRTIDGDWVAVDVPPDALVVNLGDMLARWTNDRYVSTPHRVTASEGRDRYSIPFFVNPDPETEVSCIPSCVSPEHPCGYEPITAADFLQGRIDGTIPLDDVRR
ncbi:MAG: 2OG-Fe(II) oxygenase family protein [Ilumatobacteraceae bacterium]